jgi:hypothetical protein
MTALEHSPLSIEPRVAQNDLGLRDPGTFLVLPPQSHAEMSITHGLVVCREPSIAALSVRFFPRLNK